MFKIIQNKKDILLQLFLILLAFSLFLFNINKYPFVDYDEATYAMVITDTIKSGDFVSLKLGEEYWFEKPPLYFWLAIISNYFIENKEIAFRLPSALLSICVLWLTFLIVKKLTKSNLASSLAFLILLFSPPFFYFSLEMRLDSGVIMAMMLALLSVIYGWNNNRFLLLVAPALAIGFLFKSFVVGLIIPIIFIYSLFNKQWDWLKNKFLWIGVALSLVIITPWHLIQHQRFALDFWNSYIVRHVFNRAVYGISNTDTIDYLYYFKALWNYDKLWIILFLLSIIYLIFNKQKVNYKNIILPSLYSVLFIFIIFTFAKTHIITYILPIYPFLSIFLAIVFYNIIEKFSKFKIIILSILSIFFAYGYFTTMGTVGKFLDNIIKPFHYEQQELAFILKDKNINNLPVYNFDWPYLESIQYYSKTKINNLDSLTDEDRTINGPAFIIANIFNLKYFFDKNNTVLPEYENMIMMYNGDYLFLLYSDNNFTLPKIIN